MSKHLLIVVDDPDADPDDFVGRGVAGVTLIHRSTREPHREQYSDPERPILKVAGGRIERDQAAVIGGDEHLALVDGDAAIDDVAAPLVALRAVDARIERPQLLAGTRVDGVDHAP